MKRKMWRIFFIKKEGPQRTTRKGTSVATDVDNRQLRDRAVNALKLQEHLVMVLVLHFGGSPYPWLDRLLSVE